MNPLSHVSIEEAPRDPAQLVRIGRFQRRNLAEKLQLLTDPNQRSAFTSMKDEDQAQALATALKAYDANGGAQTNGAAHAPAPAPAPAPAAPPPQTAAPAPAPAPTGGGGLRRNPKTSTTAAAAAQATSAAPAPTPMPTGNPIDQNYLTVLNTISAMAKVQTEVLTVLKSLSSEVDFLKYTASVNTSLMLVMSEQTFGDNSEDFRARLVNAALEDMDGVQEYLQEAMGKAKTGS